MGRLFVFIASFFVITSFAFVQQTRFVDESGVDEGDCADPENPCASIGFAIDQSEPGDVIDIATGTYTESIAIDLDLTLQGAGRDETIIQAHEEAGQAESRVLTFGGTPAVTIAGVTIRHGRVLGASDPDGSGGGLYNDGGSLTLVGVAFESNEASRNGGGLFTTNSSPTLIDVVFADNVAQGTCNFCGGGGLYNTLGDFLVVTDVLFEENGAANGGGGMMSVASDSLVLANVHFDTNAAGGLGGGFFLSGDATLVQSTFHHNDAASGGGMYMWTFSTSELTDVAFTENSNTAVNLRGFNRAILRNVTFTRNTGRGLFAGPFDTFLDLRNVTFMENTSSSEGAGMSVFDASSVLLADVTFSGNEASGRGGGCFLSGDFPAVLSNGTFVQNTAGLDGGGLWNSSGDVTLTNVTLWGNEAADAGGGMYNLGGDLTLMNVTISENAASGSGGGINSISGSTPITNTIIWENAAEGDGDDIATPGSIELFHSLYSDEPGDIEAGDFQVENSLTEDPLFVDPENGDLRLTENSPAIEAGDPATDPALFPVNDEGDPIDLDGNPRLFGDVIDIGAYEHQGTIADETLPEEMAAGLSVPRPNPVRGSASFSLRVPKSQAIVVEVFDVTGRRVQTLFDGALAAGTRENLTLDASTLPAGVYVIRAAGEVFFKTRRVTVVH